MSGVWLEYAVAIDANEEAVMHVFVYRNQDGQILIAKHLVSELADGRFEVLRTITHNHAILRNIYPDWETCKQSLADCAWSEYGIDDRPKRRKRKIRTRRTA